LSDLEPSHSHQTGPCVLGLPPAGVTREQMAAFFF
jgi:hypothetical protein